MHAGWLCYGGLLERFEERNSKVLHHISGIVCDSCPQPKVLVQHGLPIFLKATTSQTD